MRLNKNSKSLKVIIILLLLIAIYSAVIEPSLLVVRKYYLDKDGKEISKEIDIKQKDSLKIVQITDTQIGYFYSANKLKKLATKVNDLNPDIVVFTGDLIDYFNKNPKASKITEGLSMIKSNYGKFAVFGNHDYMYELPKIYKKIMNDSGFELLVNDNKDIKIDNNRIINILGADELLHGNPDIGLLESKMKSDEFNLLLLHEPDMLDKFKNKNIGLALAGHSHGGQIRFPFVGALVTPPYGRKYTKGFYEVNENKLYVSSGLGSTKIPFRLFNVPEIVEFNIMFN